MSLSDLIVRQAKATGSAYTLPDFDGLCLAVTEVGNKSRQFRYCWRRKQKRMSFGGYPEVSLREARQLRDEARALVAKGVNAWAPLMCAFRLLMVGDLLNIFDIHGAC